MKDRLIELLRQGEAKCAETKTCNKCEQYGRGSDCQRNLIADHLIANGVIVPPVKVGQTVWFIRDKYHNKIEETNVEKVIVKNGGIYIKLGCNSMYETSCNSIGKTVFLTKEEAEKALAKMKGGEE